MRATVPVGVIPKARAFRFGLEPHGRDCSSSIEAQLDADGRLSSALLRYFTRERLGLGDTDPDDAGVDWDRDIVSAYAAHVKSIRDRIPHALWLIATGAVELHDALFDLVEIRPAVLRMRLLAHGGERDQSGEQDPVFADLRYEGWELVSGRLRDLEKAVEAFVPYRADYESPPPQRVAGYMPLGQILYDEVDVVGDLFQHSVLVDPLGDFTVRFSEFSLTTEPLALPLPRDLTDPPRVNFLPNRIQRFLSYD